MAVWLLAGASVLADQPDGRLDGFYRQFLQQCFERQPMEATRLGDHRFDDRLDDLSAAARAENLELVRNTLARLPQEVDFARLSPDGKIDFEIFRDDLTRILWLAENRRPFEQDPRVYGEYISDSVFLLLSQSTLPKETNVANAIARMKQIPKVVAAARQNLARPPRVATETAIGQNRGAIAFYEHDIYEQIDAIPQRQKLKEAAKEVVACLKEYQKFLEEELLPRADGPWRLGKEKFDQKLHHELAGAATADEVLASAETEFARLHRDMYVIARQLWSRCYPDKPLPPDTAEGRRTVVARVLEAVGREHGRPEDLTRDARATVERIKRFIAEKGILRLPEPDLCRIIDMPEFQRGNSTAYLNSSPPLDPKAASQYAVSPPPKSWDAQRVESLLQEYNRHMLQILTIHEAYPGHYIQLAYANRTPSLIRRVIGSGVCIEGWAVYTEQMMLDQGYGDGDLSLRLTQLKFYLRAVANAILDHKMHCTAMTDDEAMHLLVHQGFQSEGEARLKVIRAKQSSCQLSTYFVGRMAMVELRREIQTRLGDRFNLSRYHEAVLEQGSVPVKYLPELVRRRLLDPQEACPARK